MSEIPPSRPPVPAVPDPIVLTYAPRAPRGRRRAAVLRWSMLFLAILAIILAAIAILNPLISHSEYQPYLGGGVIGTPAAPLGGLSSHHVGDLKDEEISAIRAVYLPEALLYLALFLATQWLFLCPRGTWRIPQSGRDPPGRRAAFAAGFIGMLLSIGLFATVMEIAGRWISLTTENGIASPQNFFVIWIVMAALWLFWTWIFYLYFRTLDRYTALSRVFRWLLAGTILELLISAPAQAIIVSSRNEDCYCELGTYTGVAFGCTAALWLFGPGAYLLFLREHRRRESLI